jgi:hypothetical protein
LIEAMSAAEIIEQLKILPSKERAEVARFILKQDDSWIPAEFRAAMAEAEAGEVIEIQDSHFDRPPV